MDKRLAWMVVGFGLLVIAGGVIGYTKGSTASLITAGPMGLVVTGFGLLALRRSVDKRLAWAVVGLGLFAIACGVIGYAKGSTEWLLISGPMGLVFTGFGVLALRGVPWARRAACYACATVAAVMLSRLLQTGKLIPGAPVAALGFALATVLFRSDRKPT